MSKKQKKEVFVGSACELSSRARYRLDLLGEPSMFFPISMGSVVAFFVGLIFAASISKTSFVWFPVVAFPVFWIMMYTSFFFKFLYPEYIDRKKKIYADNLADFELAQKIKDFLNKMLEVEIKEFPLLEKELVENIGWRPFTLSRYSDQKGSFDISSCLVRFATTLSIRGTLPYSLFDSSSVIVLAKGEDTQRIILQSVQSVRDLIMGIFLTRKGRFQEGTHCYNAFDIIDGFNNPSLVKCLGNTQATDELEWAMQKPFDERLAVTVKGVELQPGVILASSLGFSGKNRLILPSGFIKYLSDETEKFFNPEASFVEDSKES